MGVRRAVAADGPTVLALACAFRAEDGSPYEEAGLRDALTALLRDDDVGQVWLLEDAAALVGYAVLTWGFGLESAGREGLLDEIFVVDGARGRGLGGLLVAHVLAEARAAGCRTIFLETEAANEAARRLYRRHGLIEEDSIWMRAELTPGSAPISSGEVPGQP
jgi:GNAT superfamily N-acetyltransferase